LGLLERKVTALDERIIAYNKEETHRESSIQKVSSTTQYCIMLLWCSQVSRLEKQLQKAQQHIEQQKNIIAQLKAQKYDVDQIKVVYPLLRGSTHAWTQASKATTVALTFRKNINYKSCRLGFLLR